jgi:hypothetical protein
MCQHLISTGPETHSFACLREKTLRAKVAKKMTGKSSGTFWIFDEMHRNDEESTLMNINKEW